MTAGLVILIWGLAGPALSEIFANAISKVTGLCGCRDERGSAVVEFALVGAILTVLTVSVLQLALALHVRNTVLDCRVRGCAVRGARRQHPGRRRRCAAAP